MSLIQEPGFVTSKQSIKTTPREFIFKYIRFLPLILICLAVALTLAWLKLRYSMPYYSASGTMLIRSEGRPSGGDKLEDLLQNKQSVNIRNEVEVLHSSVLAGSVVTALNLQTQYHNIGNVKYFVLYTLSPFRLEIVNQKDSSVGFTVPIIVTDKNRFTIKGETKEYFFGEKFMFANNTIRIQLTAKSNPVGFESKEFAIIWMPKSAATGLVNGSLDVSIVNGNTTILGISLESQHPLMAADIINQLMKEYNYSNVEEKRQTLVNTVQFIDERLDTIKAELSGVEKTLQRFAERSGSVDLESQSQVYIENLSQSTDQIVQQQVKINILNYLLNYLSSATNNNKLVPNVLDVEEPTLPPLINGYNQMQMELQTKLQTVPEGNQRIKDLQVNIENLRQDIIENLNNVKKAYYIQLNSLEGYSKSTESRLLSLPGKGKEQAEIGRQQKILEELYKFLLTKKIETSISSASTIANSRVLEPASASWAPVKPDRKAMYFMAFFFGLIIPIGFIAIKEYLNDKIESREDLESLTPTPLLGEIGHVDDGEMMIVKPSSRTYISEQFRIIRTNLQFILKKIECPVILITSSFGGEGKSFVSTNVGAVMAIAGKKTVVLELDIRKPKVMAGLDLKGRKGFTNYVMGSVSPEELPVKVPDVDNLYIIPCGPLPPNPVEILMDPMLDELMVWLKKNFDVIIIDSAPVGIVSDSMILSRFADCTLYLVRQQYTFKKQAALITEILENKRLPKLLMILNDVQVKRGYGSYYGYGYGYATKGKKGDGYFEEDKSKNKWFNLIGNRNNPSKNR